MRLYYFFGLFFSQKTQKSSGVIIVCSGFEESVCQILLEKKIGNSLKRHKMDGYVTHRKVAPNLWRVTFFY